MPTVRFTQEDLERGDDFARAWDVVFRHIQRENEWAEELEQLIADEKRREADE